MLYLKYIINAPALQTYPNLDCVSLRYIYICIYESCLGVAVPKNTCVLVTRAVAHVSIPSPQITTQQTTLRRTVLAWEPLEMDVVLVTLAKCELRSVIRFFVRNQLHQVTFISPNCVKSTDKSV